MIDMNPSHVKALGRFLTTCILSTAVLLMPSCSSSKKATVPVQENALLWEVSGKGLKAPSYVYGTIHMICSVDYRMSDTITQAFNQSRQLYLELDMDDPAMMMKSMQLAIMKGKTLKDIFKPEDYAKLEKYVKDNLGMPMMLLNTLKPIAITSLLTAKSMPCDKMESYEQHFQDMAKARKIELKGLETLEYQFSVFDRIPDSAQARMIMDMIGDDKKQKEEFNQMVEAYKRRDLNALGGQINDAPDIAGYEDILLKGRNANWVPIMEKAMAEMPSFFAVGAGHLPGKDGVLALLRKAGYQVKPVY
jgi:uncharacterized protein YbaP (TraB family)